MRITFLKLVMLLVAGLAIACQKQDNSKPVHVIPEPYLIEEQQEKPFVVDRKTRIVIGNESMRPAANSLKKILHLENDVVEGDQYRKNCIVFSYDPALDSLSNEGYLLEVTRNKIEIKASAGEGLFYATETIRQMLGHAETNGAKLILPAVKVIDKPRFAWRGMHLDVSRHFMPLDFIKRYIDYLAMHKFNVFHWHLVDGIGWRIEIKSHPVLTDVGAWRVVKEGKKPWEDFEVWRAGDPRPKYGGYYTQEEIKEVVQYAKERSITVIPEIELPGHSQVVFDCYPELICKHKNGRSLGNAGVYCATNEGSYRLLEEVIDEVLDLFPSEYIHIGGDEVGKGNWNACAHCTAFMKKKGYDAHDLQSHFVNHFDKYLKGKGRKLVGWHEILEGQLSETATIMYWGAENGVASTLKRGHDCILTTGSHLYFDHYQSLSSHEPKAFGGYSSLKKVYDYEPVPEGMDTEYTDLIMGVQGNVWTEYMDNPKHVEYMTMPRMAALSEVAWQKEGSKDWAHFRTKMDDMLRKYRQEDVNYANSAFRPNISFQLDKESKDAKVNIETELIADIYYTLDGKDPVPGVSKKYTGQFRLSESAMLKAIAVKENEVLVEPERVELKLHKARGARVNVIPEPKGKYRANGGNTLVDVDFGGNKWGNGKWLGMLLTDFDCIIELDAAEEVSKIAYSCIEETAAGIVFPQALEIEVSEDGKTFKKVKRWNTDRSYPIAKTSDCITKTIDVDFDPVRCKFLKVKTEYQRIPNVGVFTFVDEIVVE